MQDCELYQRSPGVETPWSVESVNLKIEAGQVHVYLAYQEGIEWPCPECASPCPLHDHQPERQWRHLDTCQHRTILHAQPPRSACSQHGVRVVKLPWAEPSGRFTALFEALAIHWLQAASQSAVAGLLNLSWDEIHGILEREKYEAARTLSRAGLDGLVMWLKPGLREHLAAVLPGMADRGVGNLAEPTPIAWASRRR